MQGTGYCECGCGEKTKLAPQTVRKLGRVAGQPIRYVHGHQSRKPVQEYVVDPETGCWIWQRYIDSKGYGAMRPYGGKRMYRAHRVYYERSKGPIPEGMQLDHLCRNRACVNPDHLEPVTNFENQRRGQKPKLSADAIREIREAPEGPGRTVALARKFDVDPSTIRRVCTGQSWSNLPNP